MSVELRRLVNRVGRTLVLARAEDERRGAAGRTVASEALDPQIRQQVLTMNVVPDFKTLKQVAAFINANPKFGIVAKTERGFASTDRKIRGTRLRHPGKGRWGTRIKIWGAGQPQHELNGNRPLLDHNNAETYRQTSEVTEWLRDYLKGRKGRR